MPDTCAFPTTSTYLAATSSQAMHLLLKAVLLDCLDQQHKIQTFHSMMSRLTAWK